MSSKTARLHRRQAANRRKYARLRNAGRVPQHTRAERRLAAAERERQREADQRRVVWLRRATLPVVGVGAAAELVFGAPSAGGIMHLYRPCSAASQFYSYTRSSGAGNSHQDQPEPDGTFFTNYDGSGTARADIAIGPVAPASWLPWEWTYSPNVLGD